MILLADYVVAEERNWTPFFQKMYYHSIQSAASQLLRSESMEGMDEMEALCKKLSLLSSKNQLKWHGSKNDLLRFLTLHLEVQPNQSVRANDNGSCAVFKIQNIT